MKKIENKDIVVERRYNNIVWEIEKGRKEI